MQLGSVQAKPSPHAARRHCGLPAHLPFSGAQSASVVHATTALGSRLRPPTISAPDASTHTEFGWLPKHGLWSPFPTPPSHCSPKSETPSPHIGSMQLERQALGTSS